MGTAMYKVYLSGLLRRETVVSKKHRRILKWCWRAEQKVKAKPRHDSRIALWLLAKIQQIRFNTVVQAYYVTDVIKAKFNYGPLMDTRGVYLLSDLLEFKWNTARLLTLTEKQLRRIPGEQQRQDLIACIAEFKRMHRLQ